MIGIFLFSFFTRCEESEDTLPFDLELLQLDYSFSVTYASGQFGDITKQISARTETAIMKANNSVRVRVKNTDKFLISDLLHFNITDRTIEMFDKNLTLVATLEATRADNYSVYLIGSNPTHTHTITGLVSPTKLSIITIASMIDDSSVVIRLSPPKKVTTASIISRIAPSIGIVFFLGFGRTYRNRFWRQFRTMNTGTLQNRMNEANKKK